MDEKQVPGIYLGEVPSALKRAKKIVEAAGLPLSKKTGKYSYFSSTQVITDGARFFRIGCSDTIGLTWYERGDGWPNSHPKFLQVLAVLREGGMPFSDMGRLTCGRDARKKMAKNNKES